MTNKIFAEPADEKLQAPLTFEELSDSESEAVRGSLADTRFFTPSGIYLWKEYGEYVEKLKSEGKWGCTRKDVVIVGC